VRTRLLLVQVTVLFCLLVTGNAVAQQAREIAVTGPADRGSKQYVFESSAPKGSLAVFRRDVYLDDKLIDRYEVVDKVPSGQQFQKTVLITLNGIKVDNGNMDIPNAFTQKALSFRSGELACVKVVYEGVRNKQKRAVTYIFSMINEPSRDVIQRAPVTASSQMQRLDTNAVVEGWTYCVDYSNTPHPIRRPSHGLL
jgi:hypothetical protein